MALTDKEINAIVHIYRVIKENHINLEALATKVGEVQKRTSYDENMNSWSDEDWKAFLTPYILEILAEQKNNVALRKHDHTNDANGGPCFAENGGLLI